MTEVSPDGVKTEQLETLKMEINENASTDLADDINYVILTNKGGRKNG